MMDFWKPAGNLQETCRKPAAAGFRPVSGKMDKIAGNSRHTMTFLTADDCYWSYNYYLDIALSFFTLLPSYFDIF